MSFEYLRLAPEGSEESLAEKKRSLSENSTDGDGDAHFTTSIPSSSGSDADPARRPHKKRQHSELSSSPGSSPQNSSNVIAHGPMHRKVEDTATEACRKAMAMLVDGTIMGPPFQ